MATQILINMKPDDKPKLTSENYEDPKLFVVIGNEIFPRAGLETAFVDYTETGKEVDKSDSNEKDSRIIGGEVCTCNKVRVVSCGCVSYKPCSCHGHTSSSRSRSSGGSSSRGRGNCRCVPVH